jgi:hypothetical protein
MLDHARAEAPRDFHGIIAAPRIDDDDVIGEASRFHAFGQFAGGVAGDYAEGERFGHAPAAEAGVFVKARFYVVSL